MEDNKLILRCQHGDKQAFQELIEKYHPYVYKFLIKTTDNKQLSEDLTQEVFIKVIRSIDKFDLKGKAKFSTYIITLSRNCYIDYYRKNKKSIKDIPMDENLTLQCNSVEEVVIDEIYTKGVIQGLEELPEEQRLVIKLKYLEGLTLKEISERLELEEKTIKSRIHNGIVKLRKMFEGGDPNGGGR